MIRPLPFVLAATDQGTMIVSHLDFCKTSAGSYGVGADLLARGVYEPEEISVIMRVLQGRRRAHGDGVVMLDCGANIGVHTVCCARAMTGWGDVIAIEAQERVFYALAGNIALGNFFNARAFSAVVSDREGFFGIPELNFALPASIGSLAVEMPENGNDTGQDIARDGPKSWTRTMTIDGMALPRVDFIKLDIEGMEIAALRGAQGTIARCRPAMFIETAKGKRDEILSLVPSDYTVHDVNNGVLVLP